MNAVARNSGAFFAYCFAYLILEQKYVCSPTGGDGVFSECSVQEICDARTLAKESGGTVPFSYKVDTSYDYYLENWYTEMDLMCTSDT